jgi:hypothetical protein
MFESVRHSGVLAETIGYSQLPRLNVMINGESRVTGGIAVSGNYFSGLGVRMALGRPLVADDGSEGGTTVAVISYRLWERAFGLDPAAVGRTIYINRKPYQVAGVTAREFYGISVTGLFLAPEIDVTLPIQMKEQIDGAPHRGNEWRSADLCWVQMMGTGRASVSAPDRRLAGVFDGSERTVGTCKWWESSRMPSTTGCGMKRL